MALSPAQLATLIDANPFLASSEWEQISAQIELQTGLGSSDHFAILSSTATLSLGWLQYIFDEPDEVLSNMAYRLSGQVRPAANTIVLIETAVGSRLLAAGLLCVNTGAQADVLTVYHTKAGVAADDLSIVDQYNLAGSPTGRVQIPLEIPLQPLESLYVRSQAGTTSISSYVA